jgi:hypothetical protein
VAIRPAFGVFGLWSCMPSRFSGVPFPAIPISQDNPYHPAPRLSMGYFNHRPYATLGATLTAQCWLTRH